MSKRMAWLSVSAGLALCTAAFADGPQGPERKADQLPAGVTPSAESVASGAVTKDQFKAWKMAHQGHRPASANHQVLRAPPPNDECDAAELLPCGTTVSVDVGEATAGADPDPSCLFGTSNNSVWYRFAVPATGAFTVDTCTSGVDTTLTLFTGSCAGLNEIGCNDDACGNGLQSRITVTGETAGATVYVMLGLYTAATDPTPVDITLTCITMIAANDTCPTATPIVVGGPGIVGDNSSAFDDMAVQNGCNGFFIQHNGVWFTFQGNGHLVTATTCNPGNALNTRTFVYSGSCDDLACVNANSEDASCAAGGGASTVGPFCSQVGVTYYVLITGDTFFGQPTTGTYEVRVLDNGLCPPPVTNDDCSTATTIAIGGAGVNGNNFGATTDAGIPTCGAFFTPTNGVWYQFNGNGHAVTASSCDPATTLTNRVTVYTGSCSGLTCIATDAANAACSAPNAGTVGPFCAAAGSTYYVLVSAEGFGGNPNGFFHLAIADGGNCPPPPANDACAGAAAIGIGSSATGRNFGATDDAITACNGASTAIGGSWYRFTGNGHGLEASTCNPGTDANTRILIFSGSCAGLTCVGGSATTGGGCTDRPDAATFRFCGASGTTFFILVASEAGLPGNFQLSLTDVDATGCTFTNDSINGATPITLPASVSGDTSFATDDSADVPSAVCGTTIGAPGVWYRVSGNGQSITATTCNNHPYDTKLNVYCGQVGNLSCVAGNDDFCGLGSSLTWCSQTGATYFILVQGFAGQVGAFTLDVSADGSGCSALVQCLPQGACCTANGCSITTQIGCTQSAGVYRGDNSSCATLGGNTISAMSSPGLFIGDNSTVTDTITLTAAGIVGDVNVRVNIPDHTFIGDLIIEIAHNNTTVRLWNRQCGGSNGMDVTFDDQGVAVVCAEPTTGTYRPAVPLSAFVGTPISGAWDLTVSDNAGADTGTLQDWGLTVVSGNSTCTGNPCPADFDGSGEVNANDISAYLNAWYNDIVNGTVVADYDLNGETNANDISAYINAWYAAIVNGGTC